MPACLGATTPADSLLCSCDPQTLLGTPWSVYTETKYIASYFTDYICYASQLLNIFWGICIDRHPLSLPLGMSENDEISFINSSEKKLFFFYLDFYFTFHVVISSWKRSLKSSQLTVIQRDCLVWKDRVVSRDKL